MVSDSSLIWKIVLGAPAALLPPVVLAVFCRLVWFMAQNEKQKAAAKKLAR